LNLGLINKIYEESELDAKTLELSYKIAKFSRSAIAMGIISRI
jgi:enoyl-CoA hydratase/carnithine racemase